MVKLSNCMSVDKNQFIFKYLKKVYRFKKFKKIKDFFKIFENNFVVLDNF